MYPKKKPKTDEERFHEIFAKKVGTTPGAYLRRKLAAGVPEGELRRMYDMLAVELARTAHCKAIRFDEALGDRKSVVQGKSVALGGRRIIKTTSCV